VWLRSSKTFCPSPPGMSAVRTPTAMMIGPLSECRSCPFPPGHGRTMVLFSWPRGPGPVRRQTAPRRDCERGGGCRSRPLSERSADPSRRSGYSPARDSTDSLILADADGSQGFHGLHAPRRSLGALDFRFRDSVGCTVLLLFPGNEAVSLGRPEEAFSRSAYAKFSPPR